MKDSFVEAFTFGVRVDLLPYAPPLPLREVPHLKCPWPDPGLVSTLTCTGIGVARRAGVLAVSVVQVFQGGGGGVTEAVVGFCTVYPHRMSS